MPIIEAYIFKGYDKGARTRLSHGLTDALRMVIPAPHGSICVLVHELEKKNYMHGGGFRRPVDALPDPRDVLRRFHTAMMAGDFAMADTFVTDDCTFLMPGGVSMSRPHEMASFTASHWEKFTMTAQGADICPGVEGPIVYERAVVNGVAIDGARITDLRTAARVQFRGPLIREFEFMSNHPLFPRENA